MYKLKEFSSSVPDFRRSDKGNIRHRLDDIIMLMILARASKCVGRTEIIEFGRHNLNKFRKLGMLKNGIPSEATLCRVEITLVTEACREKNKEIKSVPRLIDTINISGKIVTADAMSMQKGIIGRIRKNGGDFLIELKANQPSLRYGVEDRLNGCTPAYSHTEGQELGHGRIETRTYRVFDGLDIKVDKEKWSSEVSTPTIS
ncbi:ISAs1 family transposase [uncultured Phocaeicola sp.]|uniref:ISAs1 family transposase n=1 Tax=uncultured Phocaeicola sp. TaxID=990718 RepID=UPI00261684D7|nr:ISAs1 family transposase [uncultured Phocaeicola sp.]